MVVPEIDLTVPRTLVSADCELEDDASCAGEAKDKVMDARVQTTTAAKQRNTVLDRTILLFKDILGSM